MPGNHVFHRVYSLHEFYPNIFSSDQRLTKYWAGTSSDDVYDTSSINDSGWSLIELPFESVNVCLGNRILLFQTTENVLVLNRYVALRIMNDYAIFKNPVERTGDCPFFILDINKVVNVAFETCGKELDPCLKCYEFNRVICDSSAIHIELLNGVLIGINSEGPKLSVDTRFVSDRIKIIEASGQSNKVIIYTEGHKLYVNELEIPLTGINSPIKLLAASPVSAAFVTIDNQFYINGDDSNGTCGGVQTINTQFVPAPKQFPSDKIVDIKCGYIHTVCLLESGSVWASGYNDLKQCGQDGPVNKFTEVDHVYYERGHIRRLKTTSRGTVLISDLYAAFVGEVVHKFPQYKNRVLVEPFSHEFNEVASGGWQYVLYRRIIQSSRSLNYFVANLKQFSNGLNSFSDCTLKYL